MGKASKLISKISEEFEVTLNTFTDVEIEKALNEGLKSLTQADIEAVEDINEAKSDFPKAAQIKSLQALRKKYSEQVKSKNNMLVKISNDYQKATDRKAKLALTKKRKQIQAEKDKLNSVLVRARTQLDKLENERKEYNKKKRKAA